MLKMEEMMNTLCLNTNAAHGLPMRSTIVRAGRQQAGQLWSSLDDVCGLLRIDCKGIDEASDQLFQHVRLSPGQHLYSIGQPFDKLYVVNSGFLKTQLIDELGNEHVLGFPMKGDMLGIDGIHPNCYNSEAVALTTCDLIAIPFKSFSTWSRTYPDLEVALYGVMSRELMREHAMAAMLLSMDAETRIARFLVSLSQRFASIGYSGKEFTLRMTRQELGSYLGLAMETVCRNLSALDKRGLIAVEGRTIVIKDAAGLLNLKEPSQSTIITMAA
jgi:CRP/FNR family transcriptional regulator, anaerobic regulatory protein